MAVYANYLNVFAAAILAVHHLGSAATLVSAKPHRLSFDLTRSLMPCGGEPHRFPSWCSRYSPRPSTWPGRYGPGPGWGGVHWPRHWAKPSQRWAGLRCSQRLATAWLGGFICWSFSGSQSTCPLQAHAHWWPAPANAFFRNWNPVAPSQPWTWKNAEALRVGPGTGLLMERTAGWLRLCCLRRCTDSCPAKPYGQGPLAMHIVGEHQGPPH